MLPKIKSLTYKVIPDKSVDYDNAPEINEETDDFTIKVNHERAIFELKGHFTLVQDARAIVDDFLESWQVIIGLEHGPGKLEFKYENAEYEQIQKDGKNPKVLYANSGQIAINLGNVELHLSRNKLPNLPYKFKSSPDVITMYQRYKIFRQGKELLTSMAYMCLTVFEASARDSEHSFKRNSLKGKASYQYNIEFDVLRKLGKLVSTKGDQFEARKVPKEGIYNPIKPEEREWIIRAIKILIRRVGEWAYDPEAPLKKITLTDI